MARDYKPKRKRPGTGLSGWMGVAGGLGLGLVIAAGVYVKDHRAEPGGTRTALKPDKKKPRGAGSADLDAADGTRPEDSPKSYAFYDMLPKFEVVVPERDKDVRPDTRAVPETRSGTYVLQAGSYKSFADADRVRAKLALQGVESKVQKVSVDNDTWHRIRIGPVSNLNELNRLRSILRKADVDVLVIRVGD